MTEYTSVLFIVETDDTDVNASVTHNKNLGNKLLVELEYRVDTLDIGQKFQYSLTRKQLRELGEFFIAESE